MAVLDKKLIEKLKKQGLKSVNVRVSQKASNLGISPEAALILIAKSYGLGTASFQKKLIPEKQREIRENLPSLLEPTPKKSISKSTLIKNNTESKNVKHKNSKNIVIKNALEYILQDDELRERCQDLILAKSKYDRAINQATLVLEQRIRTKSQPATPQNGSGLVNYAIKNSLSDTVLKLTNNNTEQEGYANIFRGIVLSFRNPTHHHILDNLTQEDALRICGFIDVLLRVIDNSQKIK
jgi:uncharacterized protein (TIGR02391 family)